jgi:maltooligosyltrehalose trehalohydrolase
LNLHRDLLRLRREDPVFSAQRADWMYGAVIAPEAFMLRFLGDGNDHRLVLINLGVDLRIDSVPEPLMVPPLDHEWELIWTSEDPRYGGCSPAPVDKFQRWRIAGHSATVLKSTRNARTP